MKDKKFSQLESLAQIMASFNFTQGKKISYSQIERFFKKNLSTGPILVFSIPKNMKGVRKIDDLEGIRIDWNKRAYGGLYEKDSIDQVVIEAFHNDFSTFTFGRKSVGEESFILFKIGERHNQRFYGLFREGEFIEDHVLSLFSIFMANIFKGRSVLEKFHKAENLIYRDDVTGLYNQRKLMKDIEAAISRHRELGEEFSILFIDIDHFKRVNDGHGHLVGTELLSQMGKLFRKVLRESDLIYRYGGDEFVMLIPDIGHTIGRSIGERVLKAVKEKVFKIASHDDRGHKKDQVSDFKLTVSIGVATFPQDAQDREEILSIADHMMYEAKRGGRGRVCFTSDLLKKSG